MFNKEGVKYDQATYRKNLSKLVDALKQNLFSAEYGEPDNLTATMMEMNLNRFGFDKNLATIYRLNEELRVSNNYNDFRNRASGILELFDDHYLKTEYDTAIAIAQNASAWNRFKKEAAYFPYLMFQAIDDDRTTAQCHALDGKYFAVNDSSWWSMYPPLHWRCRSEMLQVKSAPEGALLSGPDAMGLLGDNYRKMKAAGFAVNRGETKDVFDLNKGYIKQLPGGRIDGNKLTWRDAQLSAYKTDSRMPSLKLEQKSAEDVLSHYGSNSKNSVQVYTDRKGRKLGLRERDLKKHLGIDYTAPEENRQALYFKIGEVLDNSDEIWFTQHSQTRFTYKYVKFYQEKSVVVVAEVTSKGENDIEGSQVHEVFNIKTFYNTIEGKNGKSTDDHRLGILIEKGH